MIQPRLKIFTWNIHCNYLYNLAQGNYDIYIPVKSGKTEGYSGKGNIFSFKNNVIEVQAGEVRYKDFDVILFQSKQNYLHDQYEILSEEQRNLPKIYLEHEPPVSHPTNSIHTVKNPDVTIVHVTHYNDLMWDCSDCPTTVIEHAAHTEGVPYTGEKARGVVVIDDLPVKGRLLGLDAFLAVKDKLPIDLIGKGTNSIGLGEIPPAYIPAFISQYRFFFYPVRYSSSCLQVYQALMQGIPVVGLATAGLSSIIQNNHSGFVHTDINYLIEKMQLLLEDGSLAQKIGSNGAQLAKNRFSIDRFTKQWEKLFLQTAVKKQSAPVLAL